MTVEHRFTIPGGTNGGSVRGETAKEADAKRALIEPLLPPGTTWTTTDRAHRGDKVVEDETG